MRSKTSQGVICLGSKSGITYHLAKLEYTVFEDDTYKYSLRPNWNVLDILEESMFDGIPGFDIETRQEEYVRENETPAFIKQRTPGKDREGLWQLLEEAGMEYWDPVLWLVRTEARYAGDQLYMAEAGECPSRVSVERVIESSQNMTLAQRDFLAAMAQGAELEQNGVLLSAEQVKALHDMLQLLYGKGEQLRKERMSDGVERAKRQGKYQGRKPKAVDELVFAEVADLQKKGRISAKEAAKRLGISVATYYRRRG